MNAADELTLGELRQAVELVARNFEPGVHGVGTIEQVVAEWGTIERIAAAAKLRCAARAEEIGLDGPGAVAAASGVTTAAARRQTRTHKKTRKHAKTAKALDQGALSTAQAEVIADTLEVAPDAEASLLALAASSSTSDLAAECERIRRDALDADGTLSERQKAAQSLRHWKNALGNICGTFELEPVAGTRFIKELERRAEQKFRAEWKATGTAHSQERRMAESLADAIDDASGGRTADGKKRRGTRTKVYLIADKPAVDRGYLKPGEKCETADGTPIPLQAVDDALIDPATEVFAVVKDRWDLSELISFSRYWPARVMDALRAMEMMCEVPGCRCTRGLEKDHLDAYAAGGPTSAGNGGWKCDPHHLQKTKGLYDIWIDDNGTKHWDPIHKIPPDKRNQPPPKRRAS